MSSIFSPLCGYRTTRTTKNLIFSTHFTDSLVMTDPKSKQVFVMPVMPFGKRIVGTMRTNMMKTVLLVMCTTWWTVAYLVYRVEKNAPGANITTLSEGIWWGIVTFLTVGYGDRYPVTPEGRFFGSLLMLTGVGAMGIVTAKISSYFLERALREGRGMVDTNKLEDHFIVCGWKEDMSELLLHILDFNPDLKSKDLVLVANISQTIVESLHSEPRLKEVGVIAGDYYEETNLRRAAPHKARKILILADRSIGPNGVVASHTEVDARTIMTAMSLSSLARGTLVAAEIIDPKMDQYLKLAQVSEVIYSREYSRLLLGNASGGTGVANIIFDLLDPKTPTVISTQNIPDSYFGQSYTDFKSKFEVEFKKSVVIGILENTGNSHRIKELALRQAQKTPDVKRLVSNLRGVRELKCNHPVLSPSSDYIVQEGSMAIVIETRETRATQTTKGDSSHASRENGTAA